MPSSKLSLLESYLHLPWHHLTVLMPIYHLSPHPCTQLNYLPLRPSLLEDHPSPNYFSLMPTIDQLLTAQLALLASFNITQITVLVEDELTCREVRMWMTKVVHFTLSEIKGNSSRPHTHIHSMCDGLYSVHWTYLLQGWSVSRNRSAELFGTEPTFHVLSITDEHNTSETVRNLRVSWHASTYVLMCVAAWCTCDIVCI